MLRLFTNILTGGLVDKNQFKCPNCQKFVGYFSYKTENFISNSPTVCPFCRTILPQIDKIEKNQHIRKVHHKNKIIF